MNAAIRYASLIPAETDSLPPLLGAEDGPPFHLVNQGGAARAVILCDHASNRIPAALGDLGLSAFERERHIAYDIGAEAIARHLSEMLDAPAVIAGFSRLVIDLNRFPDDFTLIREISDRTVVPGNRNLTPAQRAQRIRDLHAPYHAAVDSAISAKRSQCGVPAVISVHSCTDIYLGRKRAMHLGVLSGHDRRMAEPLLRIFGSDPAIDARDNEPYSGHDPYGCTIEAHVMPHGLPNILFEFRQDLIRSPEGQRHWAGIAGRALAEVLADDTLYRPFGSCQERAP